MMQAEEVKKSMSVEMVDVLDESLWAGVVPRVNALGPFWFLLQNAWVTEGQQSVVSKKGYKQDLGF